MMDRSGQFRLMVHERSTDGSAMARSRRLALGDGVSSGLRLSLTADETLASGA